MRLVTDTESDGLKYEATRLWMISTKDIDTARCTCLSLGLVICVELWSYPLRII